MPSPSNPPILRLYGTMGCHLCESAENLVHQALAGEGFERIEIADNESLLEHYGLRIPVVQRIDTGEALDWPFDLTLIQHLLQVPKVVAVVDSVAAPSTVR